ncbi:hypothetical protein AB3N58_17725 (plasmid) [Leptospira sp. WS60.C2]
MQEIKINVTKNLQRDSIITGFERILFERDYLENLWIGSWSQSPIPDKNDGVESILYEFPIGFSPSDNSLYSNPDTVSLETLKLVSYFNEGKFFNLPARKLTNSAPYQILNFNLDTLILSRTPLVS